MANSAHAALIRRLELIGNLDAQDRAAIECLPVQIKEYQPGEDIVREGERVHACCILMSGFAFRYRTLLDGKRQIIAFHLPGDIPDLHSLHINVMDHSFAATDRSTIAFVHHDAVWALCREREKVAALLWLETLIDGAIFREWIVGLGRRSGRSRTAHLLCELAVRLRSVGLAPESVYRLPLTQHELADALGLTVVTVNRVLQDFRSNGLVDRERSRMVIKDWTKLSRIAEFDPTYLHMRQNIDMVSAGAERLAR